MACAISFKLLECQTSIQKRLFKYVYFIFFILGICKDYKHLTKHENLYLADENLLHRMLLSLKFRPRGFI